MLLYFLGPCFIAASNAVLSVDLKRLARRRGLFRVYFVTSMTNWRCMNTYVKSCVSYVAFSREGHVGVFRYFAMRFCQIDPVMRFSASG